MKNRLILLLLIPFLILLFSIAVSALWQCERIGNVCTCTCINTGSPTCSGELFGCGGGSEIDITPPEITLLNPIDGNFYSSRYVNINVLVDEKVRYIKKIVDGSIGTLCWDCSSVDKSVYFYEGPHELTIQAEDYAGNINSVTINMNLDTKEPRIRSVSPRDGEYVGLAGFSVSYDEDNLDKIELHYGVNAENIVRLSNCPSGTDQRCTVGLDLRSYDGNDVQFYFSVYDKASRVDSNINIVKVDITNPVITLNSLSQDYYNNRRVNFDIGLSEEVKTLEWSDNNARARRLCSRCTSYDRDVSFRDGQHDIIIRAIDYAGNIHEVERSFIVDSRSPRVRRTYPRARSYANGEFSVMYYEEVSLEEVKLYYGLSGDYNQVSLEGCSNGRNKECSVSVDLSEYDGQTISYYFSVKDHFNSVNSRVTEDLNVDVTFPEMTINSPVNQEYDYYDRVPFNIQISEKVNLEYSLDGGYFRRLCSRCSSYNYERAFSRGTHNLVIQATDAAGNSVGENIVFSVV